MKVKMTVIKWSPEKLRMVKILSRHYEKTNEKDVKKMKKCQTWVVR